MAVLKITVISGQGDVKCRLEEENQAVMVYEGVYEPGDQILFETDTPDTYYVIRIDASMDEILEQVPLRDEAKEALLKRTGRCGMLYDLALSYEEADWSRIDDLAEALGIPTNLLTSVYFNCMEEVNRVWKEITSPEPNQLPPEDMPEDEAAAQPV